MREIKFRAWDLHNQQMMDVITIDFRDEKSPYGLGWFVNPNYGVRSPSQNRVVIMQYTGLKDKNGVEIYEGDILVWVEKNMSDDNTYSEVLWGDAEFLLKCNEDTESLSSSLDYWEVIGNIYENPELVNGQINKEDS